MIIPVTKSDPPKIVATQKALTTIVAIKSVPVIIAIKSDD